MTVSSDFGDGCYCQNSCQCMDVVEYEVTIYALESVVFPSECEDDGSDDDYLITKVPEFLSFSIENDETNSDFCTTGCWDITKKFLTR